MLSTALTGLGSLQQALDLASKEAAHSQARVVFAGLQRSMATILMLNDNSETAQLFQQAALRFQVRSFISPRCARSNAPTGGCIARKAVSTFLDLDLRFTSFLPFVRVASSMFVSHRLC